MGMYSIEAAGAVDPTPIAEAVAAAVTPEIGPAVEAVVITQCEYGGAIRSVVRPMVYGDSTVFTGGPDLGGGETRYELVSSLPPGRSTKLVNLRVKSDIAIIFSVWSDDASAIIIGDQSVGAGVEWDLTSAEIRGFKANDSESMTLRVSDLAAVVSVTYRVVTTDD